MVLHARSLSQQAYDHVRRSIFNQTLRAGERVVIDSIAQEVGTGIGVVRESLFRLMTEGLLDYRPNKGFRVSPLLDKNAMTELYEVRSVLEPSAVMWAAGQMAADRLTGLRQTIEEMYACSEQPVYEDYIAFQEADSRFHRLLFHYAGNQTMERLYGSLYVHLHMARFYEVLKRVDVIAGCEEHEEIVRALAGGDPAAARESMVHHLEASRLRFLPVFQSDWCSVQEGGGGDRGAESG